MNRIFILVFFCICTYNNSHAQEDLKSLRVITYNIWNGLTGARTA